MKAFNLSIFALLLIVLSACSDDDSTQPILDEDMLIESGTYAATSWYTMTREGREGSKVYLVVNGNRIEKQLRFFEKELEAEEWEYRNTTSLGSATMVNVEPFCITAGLEVYNGFVVLVDGFEQFLYLTASERYSGEGEELTSSLWVNTEMYNYDPEDLPEGTNAVVTKFNPDMTGYFGFRIAGGSVVTVFTFTYSIIHDSLIEVVQDGTSDAKYSRYVIENNTLYLSVSHSLEYMKQ